MDPLLLEALRFGVAILAGGIVAVIAQRIAFRHAQKLQREAARERETAIRRALVAEIRENMRRLGPKGALARPIIRSAWDAARSLPLAADVVAVIAEAYALGDVISHQVEMGSTLAMGRPNELEKDTAIWLLARTIEQAEGAHRAFAIALGKLGEPLPFDAEGRGAKAN